MAHEYGMAEFMPADCEQFERINDLPCNRNVPQHGENDGIHNYLSIRLEHEGWEVGKGGDPRRRAQSTERQCE